MSNPPPNRGNCHTCFGGFAACKHLEFLGGEPDGCKLWHDPVDGEDVCDQFECDPEELLDLAAKQIDKREEELHALRAHQPFTHLITTVEKALVGEAVEADVQVALQQAKKFT